MTRFYSLLLAFLCLAAPLSAQPYLYWVNQSQQQIGRASFDRSATNQSFIPTGATINGIDRNDTHLFWADASANAIQRSALDGSGTAAAIVATTSAPWAVLVDGAYVYWTCDNGTIGRASLDGSDANHTFITGATGPRGLATDGTYLYWTNAFGDTIGRANLDGSNATQSFISGLHFPNDLTLQGSYLYWAQPIDGYVGRASVDGTGVNTSFISGGNGPIGISTSGTHLYWANSEGNTIGRAKLDGSNIDQSFITGASRPYAVVTRVTSTTPPVTLTDDARGAGLYGGTFSEHACAISTDGAVKCWGKNEYGQLGEGNTASRGDNAGEMGDNLPTVDLGAGRTAVRVATGFFHSCALLDNGTVKCWGRNTNGQLGQGATNHRGDNAGEMGSALPAIDLGTGRTAKGLVVGANHSCALLDDNTVKCWGINNLGQLGLGDQNHRGDSAGEMGNNLPTVDLGMGRTAKQLAAGSDHTCALLDDDTVKCWGLGDAGQLGTGLAESMRGEAPGEMGDNLPTVDLGTGMTPLRLYVGGYFSCALLNTGTVKCWGQNSNGQLGRGNTQNRGNGANQMGDYLPVLDLGTGRTVKTLTTGENHACAVLDDNTTKCWGRNDYGQLGLGDTNQRGDNAGEMGDALPVVNVGTGRTAAWLAAGRTHTCAVLDDQSARCWGNQRDGRLGNGTGASSVSYDWLGQPYYTYDGQPIGDNANEMGDNIAAVPLGASYTLPVELTSFTATLDGTSALLIWETASETNNSGFDVEHRTGTSPFRSIGFAPGRGTTLEASRYHFTADNLTPGRHVFRLRQVDFDGAVEYSPEVELTLDADGLALALVGLPATTALRGTLVVPGNSLATMMLYDALGRKQAEQQVASGAFSLDVSTLASGLYVVRVEAGAQTLTQTVVVAR